jgi:hypothetical protein
MHTLADQCAPVAEAQLQTCTADAAATAHNTSTHDDEWVLHAPNADAAVGKETSCSTQHRVTQ